LIVRAVKVFYIDTIPGAAIGKENDIAYHTNGKTYIKKGGRWILLNSGMRGNAVFVSETAPVSPKLNDIWIQI